MLWTDSAAVMMHTVADKSTDNAKPHSICQISRTLKKVTMVILMDNNDNFDYDIMETN